MEFSAPTVLVVMAGLVAQALAVFPSYNAAFELRRCVYTMLIRCSRGPVEELFAAAARPAGWPWSACAQSWCAWCIVPLGHSGIAHCSAFFLSPLASFIHLSLRCCPPPTHTLHIHTYDATLTAAACSTMTTAACLPRGVLLSFSHLHLNVAVVLSPVLSVTEGNCPSRAAGTSRRRGSDLSRCGGRASSSL